LIRHSLPLPSKLSMRPEMLDRSMRLAIATEPIRKGLATMGR
jgi:hypothetical protein